MGGAFWDILKQSRRGNETTRKKRLVLTVVPSEYFLLQVVRLAHVGERVKRLGQGVGDARRRDLLVEVEFAAGVRLVVVTMRGREVVRKVVRELVLGVSGVKVEVPHIDAVAVGASIDYVVRAAVGLVVGVCVAVLVDACVFALGAWVARGVGWVVLHGFVLLVAAHLLAPVPTAIAAICLSLVKSSETCGLLVCNSEGMGSLGALIVLNVVGFTPGNVDKDFVRGLRADELGRVDFATGRSLVRMMLEGQLVVGFLDCSEACGGLDAQDGVVIDESSHHH